MRPFHLTKDRERTGLPSVLAIFQRRLGLVVAAASFLISLLFLVLQTRLCVQNAEKLMALNLEDVRQEIRDQSDRTLINAAQWVSADMQKV